MCWIVWFGWRFNGDGACSEFAYERTESVKANPVMLRDLFLAVAVTLAIGGLFGLLTGNYTVGGFGGMLIGNLVVGYGAVRRAAAEKHGRQEEGTAAV
jgi:hypothetical protein